MTRVGFALGYGKFSNVLETAHWMRAAEERGFEMGFFSETIELMRDSVSALTAMALHTERLTLGSTQIVRFRSPVVMAQTLATLDELTGGRMTLAPGACTATHARVHGLDPNVKPIEALEEWIAAMRLILTGERIDYHGRHVHLDNVGLAWEPVRRHVPIYLPATSRVGLRLAGRIGDGVVLNAICSPEYTENALRIIRASAEAAGRRWEDFEVTQLINCSIDEDRTRALDAVRWEVATKFDPVQLPFNARPRMRVGEPHIREEDIPLFEKAFAEGGMAGLIRAVPDAYVEGLTASGTPDEVKARVERYREAGVKLPLLRPAAPEQTARLLDLFAA